MPLLSAPFFQRVSICTSKMQYENEESPEPVLTGIGDSSLGSFFTAPFSF